MKYILAVCALLCFLSIMLGVVDSKTSSVIVWVCGAMFGISSVYIHSKEQGS